MGLALQKGELLRSRLSTDALSLIFSLSKYLCLHLPHLTECARPPFFAESVHSAGPRFSIHTLIGTPSSETQSRELSVLSPENLGVVRDLKSQQATPTGSIPGDKSRNEDNAYQKIGRGPLSTPCGRA